VSLEARYEQVAALLPAVWCDCVAWHYPGKHYYVSQIRRKQGFKLLLGPYDTHSEALANVSRGCEMSCKADRTGQSDFDVFGTCSTFDVRQTAFGK
jgi:hypothetical protein